MDLIAATKHDLHCRSDYQLLFQLGIKTVRDSFRWPLIEKRAGIFEWTSVLPMLMASVETGTQVIWDLCHFGLPDCVDAGALDFPQRFAAFAREAARLVLSIDGRPQWWCPINEMSYWAYAAGDLAYMGPAMAGRADFFKLQLAAAYLEARAAILSVDPRAKFLATDPLICVTDQDGAVLEAQRARGYQGWDMLLGLATRELEGHFDAVDAIGVNYYPDNQWRSDTNAPVGMGQRGYRPLRLLLKDVWARYRKPILVSETGAEDSNGQSWLTYVHEEVRRAQNDGVPVLGICIYPVTDYPGWVDDRHCKCGFIELNEKYSTRTLRKWADEAGAILKSGC